MTFFRSDGVQYQKKKYKDSICKLTIKEESFYIGECNLLQQIGKESFYEDSLAIGHKLSKCNCEMHI